MTITLELVDDAGQTLGKQLKVQDPAGLPTALQHIGSEVLQLIATGRVTFTPPPPTIVLAKDVPKAA
jgi:hypothetical protein